MSTFICVFANVENNFCVGNHKALFVNVEIISARIPVNFICKCRKNNNSCVAIRETLFSNVENYIFRALPSVLNTFFGRICNCRKHNRLRRPLRSYAVCLLGFCFISSISLSAYSWRHADFPIPPPAISSIALNAYSGRPPCV